MVGVFNWMMIFTQSLHRKWLEITKHLFINGWKWGSRSEFCWDMKNNKSHPFRKPIPDWFFLGFPLEKLVIRNSTKRFGCLGTFWFLWDVFFQNGRKNLASKLLRNMSQIYPPRNLRHWTAKKTLIRDPLKDGKRSPTTTMVFFKV